jgi:hypothetical protein
MSSLFADLPENLSEKPNQKIVFGDELSQFSYTDFLAQQKAHKELLEKLEPQVIAWFGTVKWFDSTDKNTISNSNMSTAPSRDFHPAVAAVVSPSTVTF